MRLLACLAAFSLAACSQRMVVTPPPISAPIEQPADPVVVPPDPPVAVPDPAPVEQPPVADPPVSAPPLRMAIGMNLAGLTNYSAELPFIDRFKLFGKWTAVSQTSTGYNRAPLTADEMDANGWPLGMPDGVVSIDAAVPLDPTPARYVLTWSGDGDFGFAAVTVVSRGDHSITILSQGSSAVIGISRSSPADYVKNVHLVREDQVAAFQAGKIFNPDFLAFIKRFSPLRTLDWTGTNGSTLAHWADRPKPSDAAWSTAPIEVQVALANEVQSDLWLNIPHLADDDYVRQALTYVRDHLALGRRLHLEWSNEVWNASFAQSAYAQAQADALWGNGTSVPSGNEVYYGYRSAQVAAIAREVFGAEADKRLSPVLATFPGWGNSQIDDAIADGVARANVGTIPALFREYAITTYFGDELGVFPGNDADRPVVLGWAKGGAAGLDAAFDELEHGGHLQTDLSLAWRESSYPRHFAQAQAWGLKLVAYEGGLSAYWYASDQQPVLTDLFNRLAADPRMGTLYAKMIADFAAAGGTTLTAFDSVGPISIFGPWGSAPQLGVETPRSKALMDASGR